MKINVYGQRWDDEPFNLVKEGDSLIINGEIFDFSLLTEGASIPGSAIASRWFALKESSREGGELIINLIYPIPSNYSPEQATPQVLSDVPDGPVALPQALPVPDEPQHQSEESAT